MTADAASRPVTRREGVVLAVVLAIALLARAWDLSGVSLNHYDEGVYVFSAWGLADAERPLHPEQRNSPIGLAFLSSLVMRVIGPTDMAPIAVNVTLGTLSVLAIWGVTRRWFGPAAAVAAAALLAANEFHVSMSRSGMTDVLFALVFMCGLPLAARALRAPGVGATLGAALMTGAAWNTKYHGWLTTAVATSAVVPFGVLQGWTWRDWLGVARRLAVITLIAIACYVPWFLKAAELAGGFDKLAAYQWSFLSPHFAKNVVLQEEYLRFFEGALNRASVPLALAAAAFASGAGGAVAAAAGVLAAVLGATVGGTVTLWALTAVAVLLLLMRRDELGAWLLLAWGASFLALIPVYNAYVRTTLPFVLACCAAGGVTIARLLENDRRTAWGPLVPAALAVAMVATGIVRHDTDRWRESRDLPEAARRIREVVGPGARVIVIGESTLAFYLEREGVHAFKGFEYWETVVESKTPVFVVTGIYIQRAPTLRKNYALLKDYLTLLGEYPFIPYDARLLEMYEADGARAVLREQRQDSTIRLFRYTPPADGRLPALAKF